MAEVLSKTQEIQSGSSVFWNRILGHQGVLIGVTIVAAVILIALSAPLIAPHDPYHQDLMNRLVPPVWDARGSWEHVFGTDHLGRDYLSRLIYGARISLLIGIGAALISGVIGTFLGVAAGYFGGRVDMVVTFLITVRLSMPVVLIGSCSNCRWVITGGDYGSRAIAMGPVRCCDAILYLANKIDGLCGRCRGRWLFDNTYFDDRNYA